jgi:protein DEK
MTTVEPPQIQLNSIKKSPDQPSKNQTPTSSLQLSKKTFQKQKKSRKPAPKATPQKNSKGRPKRAAQQAKKKKKDESEDEESAPESEEEDDEPLKKPPKKGAAPAGDGSKSPTDDDIKTLLKDILAEANLEEITMKTVCKKVYAHYPNHDLSARKDFIKATVKSVSGFVWMRNESSWN